eukprot:GEMP01054683.1.p1 GENE.GEMP01054683.1~~GEMP01054683.1.p1  ORF type:complete len:166 (+),score=40.50 GEMP01054683.1:113-610(+)
MENADAIYHEEITHTASNAVAKALPKAWAAKAKAYAAAKAAMPPGPPLPRHALEESLDQANDRPNHRALLRRATAAPARAKAKAKAAAPGGVPLNGEGIGRVERLTEACFQATIPLRKSLKRQRNACPVSRSDEAANAFQVAETLKEFDATVDARLDHFLNGSNL